MYQQFYLSNCDPFVSQFFPHICSKVKHFANATSVVQGLELNLCVIFHILKKRSKITVSPISYFISSLGTMTKTNLSTFKLYKM